MNTLYAVVNKENNAVIGFKVSNTFPKKGNSAKLVYVNHDSETGKIIEHKSVDVFFSTAKGYVSSIDIVPSKVVLDNTTIFDADYIIISE